MTAMLAEITWNGETIMAIGMMLAMAGVPLAAIVGWYWMKLHQTRSDNALKQAMVQRGMSAAEIERVMAAGGGEEAQSPKRAGRTQESVVRSE